MYVTRPHTSLRLLVPNKSLHLHHCTATIWVTLYVIWHPLYKPDRYLPIHSTMTSFAFRTRKCVEYTVMCLVIWIGLQTVFRAMYTGTFFLLQCDIITGVSSVEEKPLPTLFFRSTHPPARPNNAQTVTLLLQKRGWLPGRDSCTDPTVTTRSPIWADCSTFKLERFAPSRRYDRWGTTHADQRRPHQKQTLKFFSLSASILPLLFQHFIPAFTLDTHKSIRVDVMAIEVKRLLIIFASATKNISRPSR